MELPESEDEEMQEEEEEEADEEQNDDDDHDDGLVLNGATSKSVVSLLAEREAALTELKLKVGNLASSFIEAPEEKIGQLERLVQMLDHLPVHLTNIGFKLVASTVTELLKDVIPAYKIAHHNQDSSDTLQKKDTLKLQKYESAVLQCAKSTLVKLEKPIKDPKKVSTTTGLHALRCVCDILVSHPQFNYSPNILKLIVPALDNKDESVRNCVKSAIQQVFREDKRGEITVVGCRYIKGYIKTKRYRCKPALVECFLGVRLNYIERAMSDEQDKKDKEEQMKKNKKREEMSKRERKRQKQLKKVEREMLEARGEEAKDVRNRNYTEVSKIVFEVLFRVIKTVHENRSANRLLPATLKCVSVFCHTINVDFFDDLLRVMSDLVKEGGLKHAEQLLCVKTAFDILSGPGEFLTYDPGSFTKALYTFLPKMANVMSKEEDKDIIPTVCATVKKMLVTRKRHVSRDVVHAFCRALAYAAVHLKSSQDILQLLSCLDEVRCAHIRTFESLLDPEEEQMPPGAVVGLGIGGNLAVRTFSLLKLQSLTKHSDPAIVKATKKLLNSK